MSPNPDIRPVARPCNANKLRAFLEGELDDAQKRAVEDHLSSCDGCCQELESIAASEELWSSVSSSLGTDTHAELSAAHWRKLRGALDTLAESEQTESREASETSSGESKSARELELRQAQREILSRWLEASNTPGALGRIGKYDVFDIVGQGGMGLVLRGYDTELRREVAIKTLSHPLTLDGEACRRLEREARAVASIHHNNILPIYGMEVWCGTPVLVMPLISGGTLHDHVAKHPLSTGQALQVGVQIASALVALHGQGVVHRDLKPSNVLLCDGLDHILLSDFGLARSHGDFTVTRTGAMAGTPFFMSPEQAMGNEVDAKSDLFSLGCVLFWMLTGSHLYVGDHQYAMIQNLISGRTQWDLLDRHLVPPPIQLLLKRLVCPDAAERWHDAQQVRRLLERCFEALIDPHVDLPQELIEPAPVNSSSARMYRRWAAIVIAIAASVWSTLTIFNTTPPNSIPPTVDRPQSYGPLDDLDRLALDDDLRSQNNLLYWLRRLAALPVDEVPAESLPMIQSLAEHPDPSIRELSHVILNKNPFQEIETIP